jgi:hypothetical protein
MHAKQPAQVVSMLNTQPFTAKHRDYLKILMATKRVQIAQDSTAFMKAKTEGISMKDAEEIGDKFTYTQKVEEVPEAE